MRLIRLGTLGMLVLAGQAAAAERTLEPSDAQALVVNGLDGRLTIEVGGTDRIEVTLSGAEEAIDAAEIDSGGDALRVTLGSSGRSVTRVGEVNVITSGGGRSEVRIGSDSVSTSGGSPVDLTARVPEGTQLAVEGLTGTAEIGDTHAPLMLGCVACEARVGEVGEAELGVTGSGTIEVAAVKDRLSAQVTGEGSIDVADGRVNRADIAIQGAGDVRFLGRAEYASAELIGAGRVRLGEVGELQRSVIGAGSIETDVR